MMPWLRPLVVVFALLAALVRPAPARVTDGLWRAYQVRKTAVDGVVGMTTAPPRKYDLLGRVVAEYRPVFTPAASTDEIAVALVEAATHEYEPLGRVARTTYPDGTSETARYAVAAGPGGALLLRTALVDGNGHAREVFTDLLGRTLAVVEHADASTAATTRYGYLPTGELDRIIDAAGNTTTLAYDLRGLMTSMTNPDTGLVEQAYDLAGHMVRRVEPNHRAAGTGGVRHVYERDRLITIDYPTKPDVTYTYGPPGAPLGRAGRIARVTDETGTEERSYGALGEVTATRRTVDVPAPGRQPVVLTMATTSDSLGRALRMTLPDGETLTNTYNEGGRLYAVSGVDATGFADTYVTDLRYDVFENVTHAELGNGVTSDWSFDPRRVRLANARTVLPSGARIQDHTYGYDAVGNPTSIASALPVPAAGSKLPGPATFTFAYDGVDRLVTATGRAALAPGKATSYTQTHAYSAIHTMTRKTRVHEVEAPGMTTVTPPQSNLDFGYVYGGPRPHAPTVAGDTGLTYDASGNVVELRKLGTGSKRALYWDDDNRLTTVIDGGEVQRNFYDADGDRVVKRGRHGETIFLAPHFDLRNGVLAEKHIFAGAMRVATVASHFEPETDDTAARDNPGRHKGWTIGNHLGWRHKDRGPTAGEPHPRRVYYFHGDHLGSTSVLTDEDGALYEHLEYFPDGELWIDRGPQAPVNGYLFTGKLFDPDTGLYDFGQRFYEPGLSLWMGTDPLAVDEPTALLRSPGALGLYQYALQNPITLLDRDGRVEDGYDAVGSYSQAWQHFGDGFRVAVGAETAAVKAAYREGGALGVVNHFNPVYGALTHGYEAKEAFGRGDYGEGVFQAGLAVVDAAVAVGGARLASRGLTPAAGKGLAAESSAVGAAGSAQRLPPAAGTFARGQVEKHFAKHAAEWGAGNITQAGYLRRAQDLLSRPVGGDILGATRSGGDILRYNVRTNEFAVGTAEGTIRTLFRPQEGMAYWIRQIQ